MSYEPFEGVSLAECKQAYDKYYESGAPNHPTPRMRGHRVQIEWVQQLVALAGWQPGSHILDLGCGIGYYGQIISNLGIKVTAIDFSTAAIKFAPQRHPGPNYRLADAISYRPVDLFDGIFCRDFSLFHQALAGPHQWQFDIVSFSKRMMSWLNKSAKIIIHAPQNINGIYNYSREDFENLFAGYAQITTFHPETRRINPRQRATQVYALTIVAQSLVAQPEPELEPELEPEPEPESEPELEPEPEPESEPEVEPKSGPGYGSPWGYNP